MRAVIGALGMVLISGPTTLSSPESSIAQAARMVLEKNCVSCHGISEMSGLDLREREAILKGGTRGPALVPGKAEESLLFLAASHDESVEIRMPPSEDPLPAEHLKILRQWINEGAPWATGVEQVEKSAAEPSWWSFKKLRRPALPRLKKGLEPSNPIDAFVLARLEEKGLEPAPRADKVTLLRRAYFDLIGLPPTPEQAERFLEDTAPDAYEKLIEELLASPRYGERWGRHWLDVVRYADSAGFEGDAYYPNAWRYRDYVVKSFNDDKPYDRFVQEQIAADELWPDNMDLQGFYDLSLEKLEHMEARVGTSLYTFGPEIQESYLDATRLRYERLTDWINTTGAAFLGLTLECARCHDHKFDPISQRDYFRLQAIFAPSVPTRIPVETDVAVVTRDEHYHFSIVLDEARTAYQTFEKKVKDGVIENKKKEFPAEVVRAYEIPLEKRTAREVELAAPLVKAYENIKIEEFLTEEEVRYHQELSQKVVKAVMEVPLKEGSHGVRFDGFFDVPSATVLGHVPAELIPSTYLLDRGELGRRKSRVSPGLPSALCDESVPEVFPMDSFGPRYRKQLALWLTRPSHPLTARVMVNRIWQGHVGRGIVGTTNDLGHQGELPTHPELLDWLASEFVDRGWSIKSMHGLIMLSDTYQRASRFSSEQHRDADPENRYLWRMNRRRLEAEAVWDSIHAVAGTLNLKMGGRAVAPPLSTLEMAPLRIKSRWVTPADPAEARRRGIYIMVRRNFTFPMFDKFDVPNSSVSCARRDMTTVAPQALWALNNQTSFHQAQQFAARLVREGGEAPSEWVETAWRLGLSRQPSPGEKQEALELLQRLELQNTGEQDRDSLSKELADLGPQRAAALTQLCLTVYNLNEFVYID